jgi:hypothetical protein
MCLCCRFKKRFSSCGWHVFRLQASGFRLQASGSAQLSRLCSAGRACICIFWWLAKRLNEQRRLIFCFITPTAGHSSPRKLKPKLSSSRGRIMTPRFQVDSNGAQNISISRRNELQHHHSFIFKSVLILRTLKPHSTLHRYILVTALPAYRNRYSTDYGLDKRGVGVRVPVGSRIFSSHVVQTGSGAHPASYPMGTWGSFPGGKAAGEWSWPLVSNYCRGQENMDL